MNGSLHIRLEPRNRPGDSEARRISVHLGNRCLTELRRYGATEPDQCLEAPPLPLAFWFVDNWWRIRWEPAPAQGQSDAEWRLAHHMPSVGAGYPWPNVSLWGEGERCAVAVHADVHNLQRSLRFIASPGIAYVSASDAETAIDAFIEKVLADMGTACDGLDREYKDLQTERTNAEHASWRKLEAMLGYDPDNAPEALMSDCLSLAQRYGSTGVEEAALAQQGNRSLAAIQHAIDAAKTSGLVLRAQAAHGAAIANRDSLQPPWKLGSDAARAHRQRLSIPAGPIHNPTLSQVLGMDVDRAFRLRRSQPNVAYGLRILDNTGASKLVLRSRWPQGRRFELCRSLGDLLWSNNDPLGPISAAKSARQKFQRAFAQEFLCPFNDLRAYIATEQPADEDIEAAARHFRVSERLVQTTLANHHIIDQQTFAQMVDAA